ncbi:MFS transporter [Nocardioides sp. B-3]|uniref:MFS transporter n=1 Tax=Nocardioides sp. B-3 TaxID=2895565 RepID=UPI00215267AC|nr:MFS transporter [Nocardioides sp. B-3]UUZ60719.1 MFS transporter [Nocardioides sp. B-3]
MSTEQIHDIGRRRAWAIWGVALSVYVLAVFHRSSLGVAGLLASERFDINATSPATFTVLQLVVYAGMQVPVGVLLDRFGSRALLLCGLVLMTAGQLAFAFSTSFGAAVPARAVLGAGDAMVFVSVIRIVSVWFPVRQAPMVTQLTGLTGQMGAIAAAAPLTFLLDRLGWSRAFATVSSIGVLLLIAVVFLVKDSPYKRDEVVQIKLRAPAQSVRTVWGNPGTRLGMWSHFTSQFSGTVFVLLWGFPFPVRGLGWSAGGASALLMAMTAWAVVSGILLAPRSRVCPSTARGS